jgi:hypothetical protein
MIHLFSLLGFGRLFQDSSLETALKVSLRNEREAHLMLETTNLILSNDLIIWTRNFFTFLLGGHTKKANSHSLSIRLQKRGMQHYFLNVCCLLLFLFGGGLCLLIGWF